MFPLHPYVPDGGMSLEELFKGRNIDIDAAQQRLSTLMEQEGLPYGVRTMTYNSRLAQELGKWAETRDGGQKIHDRLYRAYFAEGKNLADIQLLIEIAKSLGLDPEEAESVLKERTYSEQIDADWQRCRKLSIMAVPTYLCNGKKQVGAQSFQQLEALIQATDSGMTVL